MSTYILVSESLIGSHYANPEPGEKVVYFDMHIPCNVRRDEQSGAAVNNTNLGENAQFITVVAAYNDALAFGDAYILVAFDCDIQGEYMATTLRDELVRHGVSEKNIVRVPFIGGQYLTMQNFKDIQALLDYRLLNLEFMNLLRKHHLPAMSIKKAMALRELREHPKEFSINNNDGTSTFTYIVNVLNKNLTAKPWINESLIGDAI